MPFTDLFDRAVRVRRRPYPAGARRRPVVVAPATADLMAKMANGHADDLATAVLLATDKPILLAPAMNPAMWATRRRSAISAQLAADGVAARRPQRRRDGRERRSRRRPHGRAAGDRRGRSRRCWRRSSRKPLAGRTHASSPPARRTSRSIRCATSPTAPPASRATPLRGAAAAGAEVTLVSGPVTLPDPPRREHRAGRDRARHARARSRRRCRPTSRCSPPRSRTGARRRTAREKIKKSGKRPARACAGREPRHPGDASRISNRSARSS